MRALHDFLAKYLLEEALDLLTSVEREKPISATDEQRADLYFEPRPDRPPEHAVPHVGVVWRMSLRRGLVEAFSVSPSLAEVRGCVRKQLNLHHGLSLRLGRVAVPDLWLLCAGRPDGAMEKLGLQAAAGWPRGFYGADGLSPLWVVALTELPETPETRLLRLCGTLEMRRAAVAEIDALPPEDPSRQPLLSMLFVVRYLLREDPELNTKEPDAMTRARQEFENFQQEAYRQGMSQGMSQGKAQGKAEGVLAVLGAKGIAVSDALRERIRACTDLDTLQRWLVRAATATTVEDVVGAA